jgi:uridine phosphorylase
VCSAAWPSPQYPRIRTASTPSELEATTPSELSCAAVTLEHEVSPIHLHPAADLAERVLLPGDPRRALAVAHALLDKPLMFNHNRGLWGYSGEAPDERLLTVQSTGMGGPSAAIVAEELIALGAKRLVRIGTCGALDERLPAGQLVAAERVLSADGASAALGAGSTVEPDPVLTAALVEAGATPATVVSTDLFYDARAGLAEEWKDRGAAAVEMEAAALLAVAERRGAAAACVLGVSDVPGAGESRRLSEGDLEALGVRLGEIGYAAVRNP